MADPCGAAAGSRIQPRCEGRSRLSLHRPQLRPLVVVAQTGDVTQQVLARGGDPGALQLLLQGHHRERGRRRESPCAPWGPHAPFLPALHQFEDDILAICLKLLDTNPKFLRDQNRDCSRRNDPVYIGRVVSAMVSPSSAPGRGGLGSPAPLRRVAVTERWHSEGGASYPNFLPQGLLHPLYISCYCSSNTCI